MTEGTLGLGATVWAALSAPKRLFEAAAAAQVAPRPFPTYVLASALAGLGSGMELGRVLHNGVLALGAVIGLLTLLAAPLGWWVDVQVTHRVARWFGGQGTLDDTRAAVGYSAIPGLWCLVPYAALPAWCWSLFVRVRGLVHLHRMKSGRAWTAASSSSIGVLVVPIVISMALRVFVIEAFKVPSGSMFPSIELGDHLFVLKGQYGLFSHSAPARGDVVVFEAPESDSDRQAPDYVKRVVAVPGDTLVVEHGHPRINGWLVPNCALGRATVTLRGFDSDETADYQVFMEFLEGKRYLVALQQDRDDGVQGPYRVDRGQYWVLGDNRSNSADSRSWFGGRGGGVPLENTRGRARWLWFPTHRAGIDLAGAPVLPASLAELDREFQRCLDLAPEPAQTFPPPPADAQ